MALRQIKCPHCSLTIVPTADEYCPSCRNSVNSSDAKSPATDAVEAGRHPPLDLFEKRMLVLLMMVTGCVVLAMVALFNGANLFAVSSLFCLSQLMCLLLFSWGVAYVYAPIATRNITALSVMIVVIASLAVSWNVQTREASRRNNISNTLRKYGVKMHVQDDYRTEEALEWDPFEQP